MMRVTLLLAACLSAPFVAQANAPIICESNDPAIQIAPIWPLPYLSEAGALCFDVTAWPGFSGSNCAVQGKPAVWSGVVVVTEDGESAGRDSTQFRSVDPIVTQDRIAYSIEWTRGEGWRPMQRIEINRLTGAAVSYFVTTHGGDSYQCRLEKRAI